MNPTALVLAALLSVSLTGCGGDEPDAKKTASPTPTLPMAVGTVQGRLVTSGGPVGTEPRTLAGELTITGPGGSVTKADIIENGRYAIQLPPGDYTITATSQAYDGTCATEPTVTVLVADQTVETDVVCPVK